jgi:hypothetical protein
MRRIVVRSGIAALLSCTIPAGAAASEGSFFAAQINYWANTLEGTGRTVGDTLGAGTPFDLEETLGIEDDDKLPAADLWFNFGRSSFLLSYYDATHTGENVLAADLVFEDTLFPSGAEVASEFDVSVAKLQYNLRFVDDDVVGFGFLVGADLVEGEGRVTSSAASPVTSTEFSDPIPVLGLNLTIRIPETGLTLYFEGSGMDSSLIDIGGRALDAQARLTWYMLEGPFGLSAGYRYVQMDADLEDEGTLDLEQAGYFAGIAVRF